MEEHLLKIFEHFKEPGLKVSPEKFQLYCTSVKYLGHNVSEDGVGTDQDKVSILTSWPLPKNAKELRSFNGLSGYYRCFIEGYSKTASPLHALLSH